MGMTATLNECFTNMMVNTRDIIIDEKGQRDVEARKAQFNAIMRDFNPYKVNDLKVALVDGKYYCFDGQMTRKVLIARNGGKDLMVPCKVYKGLTLYDAAMLFCQQNENKSVVSPAQIIRVCFNYGDKDAIGFVRETEKNGMYISWSGGKSKYTITAVQTAFELFKSFEDAQDYGRMIRVIRQAWNGDEDAVKVKILKGLAMFLRVYRSDVNEERLIDKLSSVRPIDIIRDAEADRSSSVRKYAVKILEVYNKNARDASRLEYRM